MRRTTGVLLVVVLIAGGCGGSGGGVTSPSPAPPINLTVYINDSGVSLSPDSVGAGPVVFIVTNQASGAESLSLLPAGASAGHPVAFTAPISPQGTAQVKADLGTPGEYSLTTGVQATALHIGASRPSGSGDLLQP